MAKLNAQIHLYRSSDDITQTCNIYSTKAEAASSICLNALVSGVTGYIGLYPVDDERSSIARAKIGNNVYSPGTTNVPAYGKSGFTSASTFTTPTGCNRIKVTVVAGGGGGETGYGSASNGGGSYVAKSGVSVTSAGIYSNYVYCTGGGGASNSTGGSAGSPNGVSGYGSSTYAFNSLGGREGYNVVATDGTVYNLGDISECYRDGTTNDRSEHWHEFTNYYGRGGDASTGTCQCYTEDLCATGGSGGHAVAYLTATGGDVFSISVGGGGAGHNGYSGSVASAYPSDYTDPYKYFNAGRSGASANGPRGDFARDGSPGFVLIEWGQGIQA